MTERLPFDSYDSPADKRKPDRHEVYDEWPYDRDNPTDYLPREPSSIEVICPDDPPEDPDDRPDSPFIDYDAPEDEREPGTIEDLYLDDSRLTEAAVETEMEAEAEAEARTLEDEERGPP